jgi:hypothetical protein
MTMRILSLYLKWRLKMKLYNEVELLKLQLAEETKEKYVLYKRIKELNEKLEKYENKSN